MYENDPEAYWKLLKNLKEDSSPNDPSQRVWMGGSSKSVVNKILDN